MGGVQELPGSGCSGSGMLAGNHSSNWGDARCQRVLEAGLWFRISRCSLHSGASDGPSRAPSEASRHGWAIEHSTSGIQSRLNVRSYCRGVAECPSHQKIGHSIDTL